MPIHQRTALSGAARFFYADFSPLMRKALAIFLLMAYNILAAFSILVAFINKMTKGRIPIMLKIYKEDFTVRSYQTDLNARMKPSAILEVMQEAAGQHSERLGLGRSALLAKNTAWVLTRVEVDMDRYPAFEETFSVETFPMPVRRCFFPRYFIFRDSNGIEIGRAATLWVLLDLGTRSMTKLDVVKALMPDNSDLLAPLGLPAAEAAAEDIAEDVAQINAIGTAEAAEAARAAAVLGRVAGVNTREAVLVVHLSLIHI